MFFSKFKHEVGGVFVKFKKMVESQNDLKIQFHRFNNGKEYTSTLFFLNRLELNIVGTKGVSQNHLLSFDDNKVLKIINWIC